MESAPNKNSFAVESATGIGLDTYIGDVNVIIFEGDRSLMSRFNNKLKDPNAVDSKRDAENDEDEGNITINTEDKTSRKTKHVCNGDENDIIENYTDSCNDGQCSSILTMMAKEETEADPDHYMHQKCDDACVLIPVGNTDYTVEEVTEKDMKNKVGTRFLNELYAKEVDIKRYFIDEEILDIKTAVDQQVNLIVETIGEIDPRFRIREVIPVGSAREGTQVVRPCEYDYILVLDAFSKPGAVSIILPEEYLKQASLEFVHVKLEDSELRSLFHQNIHNHDELLASSWFPWKRRLGLGDIFYAAVSRSVKLCSNKIIKKNTGYLTCKSSKPEQHGPACTIMFEWHRNTSEPLLKISVDLCQALKIPWEVYEDMLQSNDCDVPDDFKNHIKCVGSVLLMPNHKINDLSTFKVTFTEAELLLTTGLTEHHIKCYKILKYVINPEPHPSQTCTSKIKSFIKDVSFPSYALKIMAWNHQFNQKCYKENDTLTCVWEMFFHHSTIMHYEEDDRLMHPFNRNSGVKVISDGYGKNTLWHIIAARIDNVSNGLKWMQEVSIDKYDYETCCRKINIRGYGRHVGISLMLSLGLCCCVVVGLILLIIYKDPSSIFYFAVVMLPVLIWCICKVCCNCK